ncbi:hypothetical protein SAMN06265346_12425 [Flavobacterium hercynium]|nr:hypothetical protein SAMN06265346_12425 [Flavobacterium hercynium]
MFRGVIDLLNNLEIKTPPFFIAELRIKQSKLTKHYYEKTND